jgi:CRP/FNR family transcriptional regulator, dissimilatory nitrate respiration regulator
MFLKAGGMKAWHIRAMFTAQFPDPAAESVVSPQGEVLLRRGALPAWVTYVDSGRVALGLMEGQVLAHQLGSVQGPLWLEATCAVLGLPSPVDAVAETELRLRRLPLPAFRNWITALPASAQGVLHDVAMAHRQQTELAVSRLAKDAEARCAEWLLAHAQTSAQGSVAVMLNQRKRLIAAQLGIAPETLSRVLRHLRERSLISGSGRVVNLVDPGGLRSLAGV